MTNQPSGNRRHNLHEPGRNARKLILVAIASMMLFSCSQGNLTPSMSAQPSVQAATNTPTQALPTTATAPPEPSPSPTQPPVKVWLAPYLPKKLSDSITLPAAYTLSNSQDEADISLAVGDQELTPTSEWVYVLVAPFPTVIDEVSSEELHSAWAGTPSRSLNGAPIMMDSSTLDVLTTLWGKPADQAITVLPSDQLIDEAWANHPSWAIVPFEKLEPRWKVLAVDGQSPIHKGFDPSVYALNIPFVLSGNVSIDPSLFNLPASNWDGSKLTTVAMTGVTAMVRATAYTMEWKGVTYPAEDIGTLLSSADITHISNEIPFSPDCPTPTLYQENLVFCSNPAYIDLLKAVGTDVIELTGDHFMDYGSEATLYTLQMYKDLGWPYFGGGADAQDARKPVRLQTNGNKIAFMGCNVGCTVKNEIPCDAIATETHPGAAQCDFDYISQEIPALRDEGYQVIFTFQHREYYTYTAEPSLVNDFGLVATAGAAIVSGSQAHQPHGFAFDNGTYIHYGLGNLFFDQFHFCPDYACDDAFIDRHVFYDGQYISTELITIRFVDAAKPRLMTPEERQVFLEKIFKASGW